MLLHAWVVLPAPARPRAYTHTRARARARPGVLRFATDYRAVLINAMENFIPVNSFTCGDMVFSGHTMGLVTFGMVCTTYIKSKPGVWVFNWAKIMIWCAISMALTLIVVTRMHYTLDVLLGVYFTGK